MAKKKNVLELGEAIVIEELERLKKAFVQALKLKSGLIIQATQINQIDISGVQFLQHMLRQAAIKGKELIFHVTFTNEQQLMLRKNGFSYLLDIIEK